MREGLGAERGAKQREEDEGEEGGGYCVKHALPSERAEGFLRLVLHTGNTCPGCEHT